MTSNFTWNLKNIRKYADWRLLLFLVLFLDVKLAVKLLAIVLVYVLQPNFNFGFRLKNTRLPLFYLVIIGIALVNWLIYQNLHTVNYTIVLFTAVGGWLLCILASHQIKYSIEKNDSAVIHQTLLVFFVLNAAISLFNIGAVIWQSGAANPYLHQGQYQKYFIQTGDYIKGITFDISTTNAFINAFGLVYFLMRKNAVMVCICMAVLTLTASIYINIVISAIFLGLFIFRSDRDQKSLIIICLGFLALFMIKISPHNNGYAFGTFKDVFSPHRSGDVVIMPVQPLPVTAIPDSQLSPEQRKEKRAQLYIDSVKLAVAQKYPAVAVPDKQINLTEQLDLPKPDINTKPYQTRTDTDAEQQRLLQFIVLHQAGLPLSGQENFKTNLPGKYLGLKQTFAFFKQHPGKILLGDGAGNFSSKQAFRASGLGFSGGYPHRYVYISREFLTNHLDIYLNFFSKRVGLHSLTNSPNSTFDQLFAEYGIMGLAIFIIGYLGFFFKQYQLLTYGFPILLLMIAGFFVEYWFEQLSVVVLFELMLFLDIKEHRHEAQTILHHAN